ncbi:unnamed protein product [Rhodiola kirilowii]
MSVEESASDFKNSLSYSRAHWVSESLIAWNVDIGDGSCYLYASKEANILLSENEITGQDVKIRLMEDKGQLPGDMIAKFPQLRGYRAFVVPPTQDIRRLLKCQLAVAWFDFDRECRGATCLQLPGVLDDLFSYSGPLGATFSQSAISLYLWAPTAQLVRAFIYTGPSGGDPVDVVQLEEIDGVWRTCGPRMWEGCYYVYEVTVYHYSTMKVEICYANDPYARGLSPDGRRTLLVDLDSDLLKPDGWDKLADEKPPIDSFSDITIYELHVRDFSATDKTVQPDFQGCYLAFTSKVLALRIIHLLPTFQFAEVDDEKEHWMSVDADILERLPPDSDEQQAHITAIKDMDGYNWGYNPVLWGVPKGSYATNPSGPSRTTEFRKMVQALNQIGLRVVLDVVYNHVHGNGPFDANSVLDKIVPGYYLRRNMDGHIENSTCVNNTASEHVMVERLILDDLLNWAVQYKIDIIPPVSVVLVSRPAFCQILILTILDYWSSLPSQVDGFLFDLMGHIMKHTMLKAKSALRNLIRERDAVDGSSIYIYGEGWDFGEVANNGRGINASQFNLPGTGIGSFNDRIRDAMLGGSPFGHPLQQGFVTGLSLQPNDYNHGDKDVVERTLAASKDYVQIGIAANLKDYVLTNHEGKEVIGSKIYSYGGVPVAYALCPSETVNYVSAHDNETLFDIVSLKTPTEISMLERCRNNHLATSIIALSQGIPFFHAGDDMLRSKSIDRDSYNSGDWFNRLDFSYNHNNWGVGLPPKEKNEKNWPLIKPRLADPSFKPHKAQILSAIENFLNMLQIRYSTPLFRLRTAKAIKERVHFLNCGPSSIPGVIVISIEDGTEGLSGLSQLDENYSHIVVIHNASPTTISFAAKALQQRSYQLHPVQVELGFLNDWVTEPG